MIVGHAKGRVAKEQDIVSLAEGDEVTLCRRVINVEGTLHAVKGGAGRVAEDSEPQSDTLRHNVPASATVVAFPRR